MKLTHLYIHPVKSCRGFPVSSADIELRGLRSDRRWMVVDADGRFLSQRTYPRMCLVHVQPLADGLRLSVEQGSSVSVPLQSGSTGKRKVQVWNDRCWAIDQGDEAAQWLSDFLQLTARLVYLPEASHRSIGEVYKDTPNTVSFADRFPILLLSEASLEKLNRRCPDSIEMERFRPNLVVSGCPPHAEDGWYEIEIGSVRLRAGRLCTRCAVPSVDRSSGQFQKEPTRTLAAYRQQSGKIVFGQNMIPLNTGMLEVGMPLSVHSSTR